MEKVGQHNNKYWSVSLVAAILSLAAFSAQAGEILSQPRSCIQSLLGGGHPFPHLKEPGRVPWTKIDGSWYDYASEAPTWLEIHSLSRNEDQRAVHVELMDPVTHKAIASGHVVILKTDRKFQIQLTKNDLTVSIEFSVREIQADSESTCAGKSVFVASAVFARNGKRPGHIQYWVLGRKD